MNKKTIVFSILVTITVVTICFFKGWEPVSLLKLAGLIPALFIIADIDLRNRLIPNRILLGLTIYRVLCFFVEWLVLRTESYYLFLISMVLESGTVVLLLCLLRFLLKKCTHKDGIGFGDIKLLGVLVLYFSINEILVILIIALISFLIKEGIASARGKHGVREMVSFAPYILVGTLIFLFLG